MEKNSKNTLETFFVSDLPQKYNVSRSVVCERLRTLQIKPHKQDNRSYINGDQLKLMDDLDAHLEAGGNTNEFVQERIDSGEIVIIQAEAIVVRPEAEMKATTPQQQELVTSEEVEISTELSEQEMIANLQAQKGMQVQATDIQEVAERAQKRAFAKAAAEETLTLVFEATEEFTIPELKQQLEQHRAACKQARQARGAAHNVNDFLSQALKTTLPSG